MQSTMYSCLPWFKNTLLCGHCCPLEKKCLTCRQQFKRKWSICSMKWKGYAPYLKLNYMLNCWFMLPTFTCHIRSWRNSIEVKGTVFQLIGYNCGLRCLSLCVWHLKHHTLTIIIMSRIKWNLFLSLFLLKHFSIFLFPQLKCICLFF